MVFNKMIAKLIRGGLHTMKLQTVFELIVPIAFDPSTVDLLQVEKFFYESSIGRSPQLDGSPLLDKRSTPLLKIFELRQAQRRKIGLHGNENHIYTLLKDNIDFQIRKIKLWFFKCGIGFITFNVYTEELDSDKILNLVSELCSVRLNRKITYTQSTGKGTSEKKTFTLRDVIKILLSLENATHLLSIDEETYQKAHCLFYGVGFAEDEQRMLYFLEMLRNQNRSNRTVFEYSKDRLYKPFNYITWAISNRVLAAVSNLKSAGQENNYFLTNAGGLRHSIFTNYLFVYMNCIAVDLKIKQLTKQYNLFDASAIDLCSPEATCELYDILNTPLHELTTEPHINELFSTYLCEGALGLSQKIKTFSDSDIKIHIEKVYDELQKLKNQTAITLKSIEIIDKRTSNIEKQLTEWISSVSDLVRQRKASLANQSNLSPAALESLQSEFVNSVAQEIANIACKDTASVDYEESQLKGMFGDRWYMLDEYTRRSLTSAKVFASSCQRISYKGLDYSGIIVSATSALENELKLRFFTGYQNYLYKNVGIPAPHKWPQSMLYKTHNGQYVRNTNFTMGSLPFVFNCSDDDGEILTKYLELIFNEPYKGSGVQAFYVKNTNGKSFIERCEDVRNNYRNAAAHTEPVSMEKAEACCIDVIGQHTVSNQVGQVQGLLFDLVQMTGRFKKT